MKQTKSIKMEKLISLIVALKVCPVRKDSNGEPRLDFFHPLSLFHTALFLSAYGYYTWQLLEDEDIMNMDPRAVLIVVMKLGSYE